MAHIVRDTEPLITIDQYERLPDSGERVELLRGRLIRESRPAYGHGILQARIARLIGNHIEQEGLPLLCATDFGCRLASDPDSLLAPDVAVTRADRAATDAPGFFPGAPELVIEIISPSNRASDLQAKVLEYLDAGVRLVWIVFPQQRMVMAHTSRSTAHMLAKTELLDGRDALPGFQITVADLFSR